MRLVVEGRAKSGFPADFCECTSGWHCTENRAELYISHTDLILFSILHSWEQRKCPAPGENAMYFSKWLLPSLTSYLKKVLLWYRTRPGPPVCHKDPGLRNVSGLVYAGVKTIVHYIRVHKWFCHIQQSSGEQSVISEDRIPGIMVFWDRF